jgi:hypothetical protein
MLQDVVGGLEAASSAVSLTGDELRATVVSLHGLLESSSIDRAIIDRIEAARSEALDVLNVEIESAVAGIAHMLMVERRRVESAIHGDSDSATGVGGWGVPPPMPAGGSPGVAGGSVGNMVVASSGSKGKWNPALMASLPNTRYVVDDRYVFETDDLGRVVKVSGTLAVAKKSDPNRRNEGAQRQAGGVERRTNANAPDEYAERLREWRDNGGHLIAAMFGGAG